MHTIAITGHRDLHPKHRAKYKSQIKAYIEEIGAKTTQALQIITPLAEGADRLMAEAAIEMGIAYVVWLPMDRELYNRDFDDASLAEFDHLIVQSHSVETMPLYWDNTLESIAEYGVDRDYQYAQLGRKMAEDADEMIALWDGVENYRFGGTAHVVSMRRDDYRRSLCIIDSERLGVFGSRGAW